MAAGEGPDPEREDRVMLLRPRKSRIYHRRKLFEYPIRLSPDTLRKLGLWRSARIGAARRKPNLRACRTPAASRTGPR